MDRPDVDHADVDRPDAVPAEPVGALLIRLREIVLAEADALDGDDFDRLDRLAAERSALHTQLGAYTAPALNAEDRAVLEQIAALDQQLMVSARESLERTSRELGEVRRGRGALRAYRRRGQGPRGTPTRLDLEG